MAQEDDLRALGKIMDFMRALSVIFLLINAYWFCYEAFLTWGFTLGIVDKILMNFQRTSSLFSSVLWTKLFCLVFLALSCLGTKGVKEESITWPKIWAVLAVGFVLFFLNWWLLALPIGKVGAASLYIFSLSVGYICLLMAGVWMSRLLKNNLMDDVFNLENESFMQETRLMENEYSVNLPPDSTTRNDGTRDGSTLSIPSVHPWYSEPLARGSPSPSSITTSNSRSRRDSPCTSTITNSQTSRRSPTTIS